MRRAAALAMIALLLPVPAAAQSERETVSLDATATIEGALPTISVTAQYDLTFGKVTLPTGNVGFCRYRISANGEREALADDRPVTGTTCAFQDDAQAFGSVMIGCAADESVTFHYRTEAPLSGQNIDFEVASDVIGFAGDNAPALNTRCPNGSAMLNFGGQLTIGAGAAAQDRAVVGRVLIDIYYGSQCNSCQ